ncbi:MAG TPA: hypothetical protein VHD36_15940 [Pirellulales bacterium]|nr:hypothetical protein [Pirellulales bacterium]
MFTFEMSRLSPHVVLFAAEPGVLLWIVIALVAWIVIFRRPRRAKAGACRKRHGFPWRAAVLVVLIVVAWRKFGPHANWSVDWNLDDEIRSLQAVTGIGKFPPIQEKDLWALHHDPEKAHDGAKPRAQRSKQKRAARDSSPASVAASSIGQDAEEAVAALPTGVPPHVARSVTQARELADRAVEEARAITSKAARHVAALKALKALKFTDADDNEPASAEAASIVPAIASATVTAPEPPGPPAAAEPAPANPAVSQPAPPAAPATSSAVVAASSGDKQAATVVAESTAPTPQASTERATRPERSGPPADAARSEHPAANAPLMPERPAWLDQPGGRAGDVYLETVMVELYPTAGEAEDALAEELQARTRAYIDRYLGVGTSKLFTVPPSYIHDRLVRDRYKETVESPSGWPMINAYALLAFDRRARAQFQRMQRDAQIEHRLLEVAGGAAAVLLVLGAVFGYLKLDTLTRGYYTRRLQLAAAVVILTVAAGTLYVVRSKVLDSPQHDLPVSAPATAVHVLPIDATQLPAS